jgi:hypothetical protein
MTVSGAFDMNTTAVLSGSAGSHATRMAVEGRTTLARVKCATSFVVPSSR